jgi:hypothetical protein
LTGEEFDHWQEARHMAGKFHRASSAVEGRNGYLSDMMQHEDSGLIISRS